MAVTKNQEYTVTVEGYSGEGAGVARIDGFVVFVSGALRGEVCRVLILKVLKSAAFAKVLEVLVPSPHRIAPDCPYFPRCGGCTYRHMDYAEELALKRRRVQDNLARIGGSEVEVEEILGAAETRRYRNKAQYPVSPDGRIGFYRARTHEVIDTRECLLVKPEADAAAEAVRQYMRDFRAAGYDERTGRGLLRHVYVRSNTKSESLICLLALRKMPVIRLTRADLRPDPRMMRKLMALGVPIAFQNLIISIGGLVLQRVVNGFGFIFMAGFNAATRLTGLIELAGNSLGSAVSTFAGQNLGAKKLDRVRLGLRRSAQIGVGMALVIALLVVLFGRSVLSLFINDDPALVEQVLTVGCRYLYVASAGLFMLYLLFVYRSTLQGLGDTVTPMISGVVELVMRIGNALLLPLLIGEWGVYFAEISAWIGAAIFLIFGYYRRMRILSAQFGESPSPAPEKA